MHEITALDLHYLLKELKTLEGSRLDTVYQPDEFYFQFHKSGIGKLLLRVERNALWLTKRKPIMPDKIHGFCQLLRKHLEGKKLTALEQIDGERILKFTFETQKEKRYLIIELFGKGNLVLLDEDNIVIRAIEERAWKDRAIKRGEKYKLPPQKYNVLKLKESDFVCDEENISKSLAKRGLGKNYATEICLRAGINPQTIKISADDRKELFKAHQSILNDTTGAHAYGDEVSAFKLNKENGKKFDSLSDAIDVNFSKVVEVKTQSSEKRKKVENTIKLQEQSMNEALKQADESQRAGELIYEHYQEIKEILDLLNKAREKHSLQEIKAKLKGHSKIKDINPKTGEVMIEI